MRLGIFGGTFNPIHEGHIRTAEYFREALSLDKVLLMPVKTPPHKEVEDLVSGTDRYNMCDLAARTYPGIEASDIELHLDEPSYTINTLEQTLEEYPGANLFLLMGSDMFMTVQDWHRYQDICELVTICTVARDSGEQEELLEHGRMLQNDGAAVFVGDMEPFPLSSTEIRLQIREGLNTDRILDSMERRYIDGLGLYHTNIHEFARYLQLIDEMEDAKRAYHSRSVASEAARLAATYGVDVKKAYVSGLLHDLFRSISPVDMLQKVSDSDILLSSEVRQFSAVWHGILAAGWLKQENIVTDPEILDAIAKHTIGGANMTQLDKVLYCADATSLDRDYEDVWEARERVEESLCEGFHYIIAKSIQFQLENTEVILEETWRAYNENIKALQQGE